MSPLVQEKPAVEAEVPNANVDANPQQLAFYRMLDAEFGQQAWSSNQDTRYASELGFRPIDVVTTIDNQAAFSERAMQIERVMREEHNIRVMIFVIVPDPEEA